MTRSIDHQSVILIKVSRPEEVFAEIRGIFLLWGKASDFEAVERCFSLSRALFDGNFPGYRSCNTDYHDFAHTLDVLLASARLMDGKALLEGPFSAALMRDLLVAALMHDSGYIQETAETSGTGAQHTRDHVSRSAAFTLKNSGPLGLAPPQALRIARLIQCTDLRRLPPELGFDSEEEELAGALLGTADILGQMGDRTYLEKLLFLYYEFREAGLPGYRTEFDILRNTLAFYDSTRHRLDRELGGLSRYGREHFRARHGEDRDLYLESIEHQMGYLRGILADPSTNFRKKLKRMDLESVSPRGFGAN